MLFPRRSPRIKLRSEALLDAALGLTIMEARLAFGKAIAVRERLTSTEIDYVISEKERIIRQSGVLEYFHPRTGWDEVGGLDALKRWLRNRGRAFSSQAKAFGLEPHGAPCCSAFRVVGRASRPRRWRPLAVPSPQV